MEIDWIALVKVAVVAFAFGVGIVAVFSVGIVGLSLADRRDPGTADAISVIGTANADGVDGRPSSGLRAAGLTLGLGCVAACVAAVGYGIWLIVPQLGG